MIRELIRPANLVTSMSLMAGVYSIVLSAGAEPSEGHLFFAAAVAILVAAVFDGMYGRVARMTGGGTEFGIQLDSLVDLVSFGVAPGVLLYKWGLYGMGLVGFFVAFCFILAGCFRLARFNTRMGLGKERPDSSEGLTITFSGGMVALLVLYHHQSSGEAVLVHLPVAGLALLLAYLMLSNIRFPVFKRVADRPITLAIAVAMLFGLIITMVLYHASFFFVLIGATYIASGLLGELLFYSRRRREDDFMYLGSLDADDDDLGEDADIVDIVDGIAPEAAGPLRRLMGRVRRRP